MEAFLLFFEELSSVEKLLWIFICLTFTWVLEFIHPLMEMKYEKWRHAGVNLVFLLTSILINVVFGILTVGIFFWIDQNNFGLLNVIHLPVWAELVIAIMFLDLTAQYFAHYVLHKVKWMWKLHIVHHMDTTVDATTGTRLHPGDYLTREVFALVTIFLVGVPVSFYIFYRIISIFFTYWSHGNFALPRSVDKALSLIFITPVVHKFHHHFERPWTDKNFGGILSIWDRIFGTFVYDDPNKIQYGLDTMEGRDENDIMYQFTLPWDKTIPTDY